MLSPYIFIGLEKNRDLFALLMDSIPEGFLDQSTGQGRFTVREALAHWADWESVHMSRIHAAEAQDGAKVPDIDEGQRVIDAGYRNWSQEEIRDRFLNGRRILIKTLHDLSNEEIARRFKHSRFGVLTIGDYAGHVLGHDAYHAEQLTRFVLTQTPR